MGSIIIKKLGGDFEKSSVEAKLSSDAEKLLRNCLQDLDAEKIMMRMFMS